MQVLVFHLVLLHNPLIHTNTYTHTHTYTFEKHLDHHAIENWFFLCKTTFSKGVHTYDSYFVNLNSEAHFLLFLFVVPTKVKTISQFISQVYYINLMIQSVF